MVALIEPSPTPAGRAELEVAVVAGESAVTSAFATNPLKLLTPRPRGRSAWVFTSSFGGGVVAGDQTRLDLRLRSGARCLLGTQASTKVYRNPGLRPSGHRTTATLESGSLLVFAPDPVQAFAGSTYAQRQEFHLAADASLVLLDWFSAGRVARGERWAFQRYASRNEVWRESAVGREPVFVDALRLDPEDGPLESPHRGGRFHCLATLLLLGPLVQSLAAGWIEDVSSRPLAKRAALLCCASPVRDGVVVRLAGESLEPVADALRAHLSLLSPLLGDDPWARKW